jgi:hypothetical protein
MNQETGSKKQESRIKNQECIYTLVKHECSAHDLIKSFCCCLDSCFLALDSQKLI